MTSDDPVGHKYVLTIAGTGPFLDQTVATEDVTGAVADLVAGLRPWLLAHLAKKPRANGWYTGCLVETDEHGHYDTYLSLATEDVVWYWDEEFAARSQLTP